MEAAPAAIPPKPKMAAMIATTRKIKVQRNMVKSFKLVNEFVPHQWLKNRTINTPEVQQFNPGL